MVKSIFGSKTFWLAVAQAAGGVTLAAVAADPHLQTVGYGAIVKSGADIGLRWLTTHPVTLGAPK